MSPYSATQLAEKMQLRKRDTQRTHYDYGGPLTCLH